MGRSEDQQYESRMNYYGKTAPTGEREDGGMVVSPRRTMIGI
jgi:hypothetical protein